MKTKYSVLKLTNYIVLTLGIIVLGMLSGCGSSDNPPPTDANPTGYYDVTGTAMVKMDDDTTDLPMTDLQGMVNGNRFIAMSIVEGLVYDGTIIDINVNDYTASVSIYRDGTLLTTATVAGTITEGSSITGTLTGTGEGNGTFTLNYALANNQEADLARVENDLVKGWLSLIGGSSNLALGVSINATGDITHVFSPNDGVFNGCRVDSGTISPLTGTSVYNVTMTLSNCVNASVEGNYNGLASLRTEIDPDDRLVLEVSNTNFSIHGEFDRQSII